MRDEQKYLVGILFIFITFEKKKVELCTFSFLHVRVLIITSYFPCADKQ